MMTEAPGRSLPKKALVRAIAVKVLNDEGFVTLETEHAVAALNICKMRADEIDVLFTDIRMPGPMNGLELAHRVHEHWRWISVLIASGNLVVNADELPAGARFLPKPLLMRPTAHRAWPSRESTRAQNRAGRA